MKYLTTIHIARNITNKGLIGALLITLALGGCKNGPCEGDCPEDPNSADALYAFDLPDHFPDPIIPESNPLTVKKVALGKRLFYETALSSDSTVSCGSCHIPSLSFADPQRLSRGVKNRTATQPQDQRNALALFNLMWHQSLFWDGRVRNSTFDTFDALEQQSLMPIVAFHEMDNTLEEAVVRLNQDLSYVADFEEVFGDSITTENIAKAIASFERTLVSYGSKYDRFLASGGDSSIFTPLEKRGLVLFFGETPNQGHPECFHCHGGYNFDEPGGRLIDNGLEITDDAGAFMVEPRSENFGRFKVPSLRNLAFTAPYMHDGRFNNLGQVLDHYESGGNRNPNQDPLIDLIEIKREDREAILAFLNTLNDSSFVTNPAFLE